MNNQDDVKVDSQGFLCGTNGKRLGMKMTWSTAFVLRTLAWWRSLFKR